MADVGRLVIRAPNWLGDAVMALPAMGAVRAAFPAAHLAIAALPSIAPVFQEGTNAAQENVLVIRRSQDEARVLAAGQFDAVLLLPNSFRTARAARHAAIRERWGYGGGFRGWMLTRAIARPRARVHQSVYYLELVRGLGLAVPDQPQGPCVRVSAATAARAESLLAERGVVAGATMVGFAPGAAYGHAKRWPPARVADLVVRLAREHGVTAVLVGADGDRDAGREIESALPPDVRVVNLIARTDLRLLAGVIARCAAFVSNDSGAMHLAGALGVPVAAIFGPTDERVTSPLDSDRAHHPHAVLTQPVFCRPCMLRDCPIDHRCMTRVTVDMVLAAVVGQLEAAR